MSPRTCNNTDVVTMYKAVVARNHYSSRKTREQERRRLDLCITFSQKDHHKTPRSTHQCVRLAIQSKASVEVGDSKANE